MKNIIIFSTVLLSACSAVSSTPEKITEPTTTVQEPSTPITNVSPVSDGLSELNAMTFSCPQAGLNAAAREAAKVPSEGHYQYSYFNIIKDATYSFYEVDFKSNAQGENDLKYCVSVYCQQGQAPKPEVSLMTTTDGKLCGADSTKTKELTLKSKRPAKKKKHH